MIQFKMLILFYFFLFNLVPTFIAFLKDVESPFDVNDYVRQYLGDSKETREFAKHFVEKRSYFRNKAKKEANEVSNLKISFIST